MTMIMIDGLKDIVLHNGVVRVDCISAGPNGEERKSGTLVIPGNVVGPVVQMLSNALQELDKRLRDQLAEQAAKAGAEPQKLSS